MADGFQVTDPTITRGQPLIGARATQAERAAKLTPAERDRRLCEQARARFRLAEEAEAAWRQQAVECLRFRAGEQWHPDQVRARNDAHNPRPCLTINQIPRFLNQIINAAQQNRPSSKVRPVDSVSDPQTANAINGLVRQIEAASDADVAFDTAFEHAVTHGRGYWRILTDYESPWSFQQVVKVERIFNPFSVYLDPAGRQHPDYHTANWGFVVERLHRDIVCQKYEIPKMTYDMWTSYGDTWVGRDECLLADYYYREECPVLLHQLRNGEVRYMPFLTVPEEAEPEEMDEEARLLERLSWEAARQGIYPMTEDLQGQVQQTRRSSLPVLYNCKFLGHVILDRVPWPGQYIPIVPVLGNEIDIEGKMEWRGLVYDMMDAGRAYNYWTSMAAETVALAPRAPYIGTAQQFKGHEPLWAGANQVPYAYLPYNVHVEQGVSAPPPQRNVQEPAIMAIAAARQQAAQDLYNTSGIQPADLGEASGTETSGKHAQVRKTESELGTAHYRAYLARAMRHHMRIILDLIPPTYHEPGRIERILGENGQPSMIELDPSGRGQPSQVPGVEGVFAVGVGQYDVVVDTGPNYLTQRQEASQNLMDFASALPQQAAVLGDLIIGLQDFDGAEEAARRIKKTLPPELLDDQSRKPEDQLVQVQAKLQQTTQEAQAINAHAQQMEQAAQQLSQENQQLKGDQSVKQAEVQAKQAELGLKQMEMQLKQRELQLKEVELQLRRDEAQGELQLKQLELQMKREEAQLRAQVDMVKANAEIEKARLSVEAEKADAREDAG